MAFGQVAAYAYAGDLHCEQSARQDFSDEEFYIIRCGVHAEGNYIGVDDPRYPEDRHGDRISVILDGSENLYDLDAYHNALDRYGDLHSAYNDWEDRYGAMEVELGKEAYTGLFDYDAGNASRSAYWARSREWDLDHVPEIIAAIGPEPEDPGPTPHISDFPQRCGDCGEALA